MPKRRLYPADRAVKLPDGISDRQAAAMMLQGMTVEYLVRRTFPVKAGQTVLLHAAAGGVGLIASQWLKHIGATVIGTAGSPEKMALAKAHGCDHVIDYRKEDVAKRVREITGGKGVPVVYDGVGKDTFQASLDSLVAARHVRQLRQCLRPGAGLRADRPRRPRARSISPGPP